MSQLFRHDDEDPSYPWYCHAIALLLWPLQLLLFGQAFSRCWAWFVSAPFNAPTIDAADACGLGLLLAFCTFTFAHSPAFARANPIAKVITVCIFYVALFGIGALIHQFQ